MKTEHPEYLTDLGKEIFDEIKQHVKDKGIYMQVDDLQIGMLANSFDLYMSSAKEIKAKGATQKPDKGGWDQVSPHYTVMRNEYQNVLKHSVKFGINAGDRERIFKGKLNIKPKPNPSGGLD